ncbi:MFS transporter [Kyrpidia spormannii]|uniref:Major facilitator superfamily MFS_1 n=1 Tax=Kyrpidia spormannii TaxID=2055160 RepID=A0ACA8Z6D2_9BACL|nr:MFS transporter [Kyrpidia spormannii]CAB3389606.1 Major facilitator superfamily MFS_1 [Kyrpidia spormannii]
MSIKTSDLNLDQNSLTSRDVTYASIVALVAWTLSVFDFILFGTLLPEMAKTFGWSTAQMANIATWVAVGTFVISLTVGPLTDYLGRKKALIVTTSGVAVSSGLTALSIFIPSSIYVVLVRALSGFGYSEQAVNTTYLSELYDDKKRGLLYSFIQGGWPIGVMLASIVTALLEPLIQWQGMFAVGIIPAIIIVLLGIKLKESPRFLHLKHVRALMRQGKQEEAEAYGRAHGINTERSTGFTYAQLFSMQDGSMRTTLFLGLAFMLNWFAIEVFNVLATTVLTEGKHINFGNSLWLLVLANAVGYAGYVFHGWLGDRIGRRETIAIGWILGGLAFAAMLYVANGYWSVLIFQSIGSFFLNGPYSALFVFMSESYATRMRGTGTAFINAMGPIGGILGALVFSILVSTNIGVLAAALIGGALPLTLSGLVILATRRIEPGKSLEELAA